MNQIVNKGAINTTLKWDSVCFIRYKAGIKNYQVQIKNLLYFIIVEFHIVFGKNNNKKSLPQLFSLQSPKLIFCMFSNYFWLRFTANIIVSYIRKEKKVEIKYVRNYQKLIFIIDHISIITRIDFRSARFDLFDYCDVSKNLTFGNFVSFTPVQLHFETFFLRPTRC